jgi:hypothetical protein
MAPILLLTFLSGPMGLLTYVLVSRLVLSRPVVFKLQAKSAPAGR